MIRFLSTTLVLFFVFSAPLYAQSDNFVFSLNKAIEYALDHNAEIRSSKLELDKANYKVKEITGTGLPQISGNVDFRDQVRLPVFVFPDPSTGEQTPIQVGTKYQTVGSLSLNQLIFDGSYFIGLRAAKEYKSLTSKVHLRNERDLRANVAKSYFLALISTENLQLVGKNIQTLQLAFNETNALYKEGFVEQLDVERFKLQLDNLKVQESKVKNAAEASVNLLKVYLGLDPSTDITLTDKLEDLYVNYAVKEEMSSENAEQNRPEFKILDQQIVLEQLDMQRYKVQRYPTIRGFANYQRQFFGDELSFDPWYTTSLWGLAVSVPIFSSGVNSNKIKQAKISVEQAELTKAYAQNLFKLQRLNAEKELQSAIINVVQQKESFELANKIYAATMTKYKEGVGSNMEVINANQDLKTAQTNYLESVYDVLLSSINLKIATGQTIQF